MKIDYRNKKILAPMVRIGTLPIRLLSLDYGADIVYTEELIDWKLIRSQRQVNDILGTIDYIDQTDGAIVFRTCSKETSKLVLQMGTADPVRALQAARIVREDVSGIDINMGCPKEFSVKGGMGAALLCNKDKAVEIMRTLVEGLDCPVTCKVRILPDPEETVAFCQRLEACGIAAIAIHGRLKEERPHHENHDDIIRLVAKNLTIPVIANGGSLKMDTYEDLERFQEETGCASVMVARAAQWNCSIFRKEGKLPLDDVIRSVLCYSVDYDNYPSNTKYCIQNMLRDQQTSPKGQEFLEKSSLQEFCDLWELTDYCREKQTEYRKKGLFCRKDIIPESAKSDAPEEGLVEMKCAFIRSLYKNDKDLPKTRLCVWARRKQFKDPVYETRQIEKLFKSIVIVGGKKYSSSYWEKSKKWSEQAAAIVCLCSNGIIDSENLKRIGAMRCAMQQSEQEAKDTNSGMNQRFQHIKKQKISA